MIRCIMQTEFLINTGVIAHISIIDIFVCYVVTEKKYYLICFPRELSQTSAGNSYLRLVHQPFWLFICTHSYSNGKDESLL